VGHIFDVISAVDVSCAVDELLLDLLDNEGTTGCDACLTP
jgi:hypothetical protein